MKILFEWTCALEAGVHEALLSITKLIQHKQITNAVSHSIIGGIGTFELVNFL